MRRDAGLNLHGIVEVADYSRRFSWGGVTETWVIGITHNALDPWQGACWGHGFVGKVTWDQQREKEEDIINCLTEENTVPTVRKAEKRKQTGNKQRKVGHFEIFKWRFRVKIVHFSETFQTNNSLDKLKERWGAICVILYIM